MVSPTDTLFPFAKKTLFPRMLWISGPAYALGGGGGGGSGRGSGSGAGVLSGTRGGGGGGRSRIGSRGT